MIKVTTESCADLTPELIKAYNLSIFNLKVILGENEYSSDQLTGQDLFDFVAKTNKLPKTAAGSILNYVEFFTENLKGYDALIHISISKEISASYNNASLASKEFNNVYVIDSKSLSTGIGLIVHKVYNMTKDNLPIHQILSTADELIAKTQASFVVDTIDYLYKGGRCTALAMIAATVFRIHPILKLINGKIVPGSKIAGSIKNAVPKYLETIYKTNDDPDLSICFITHTKIDDECLNKAKEFAKSIGFKEIYDTEAGAIISSHCGPGTLGLLYINK
jgi:DegV family protein with EDD domain